MKKIPVLLQLVIILSIILIIPLTFLSQYFNRTIIRYSEDEIIASEMTNLRSDSTLTETVLFGVIDEVFQLVQEDRFKRIKDINTYEELNSSYDNIVIGLNVYDAVKIIQSNNSDVYSAFFYLEDSDYVVSTNKGIVPLTDFESMVWLETSVGKIGTRGAWYPRKLNKSSVNELAAGLNYGEIDVLSYVYRLNSLTTTTRGTIVINFYESAISNYMNPSEYNNDKNSFIMNDSGDIISHNNKEFLYQNVSSDPNMQKILNFNRNSGYDYFTINGEKYLYTYYRLSTMGWTFVSSHPMKVLMERSNDLLNRYILITLVIICIGTILSVGIAYVFSKPIRQLVLEMKNTDSVPMIAHRNELAFIAEAVDKFRKHEDELRNILKSQEKETKKMAIHNLLHGEVKEDLEIKAIRSVFPSEYFLVALMEPDRSEQYLDATNPEIRRYRRNLLYTIFDEAFSMDWHVNSARYEGEEIAIIINTDIPDRLEIMEDLKAYLGKIKESAKEILEYTVTFGVSEMHNGSDSVKECVFEALEAVKKRMVKGNDNILFYDSKANNIVKFHYFYNSENKIINYLEAGDPDSLRKELYSMVNEIKDMEDISNENIMLVFNQLIGTGIKYLADHNINASKVFGHNVNMYTTIENMNTVEYIAEYIFSLFQSIIAYFDMERQSEINYFEKIDTYIRDNYKDDFLFEDLAEQIGISYSYMRRIVKEETGKSLIDLLNLLRVEEAKRLLQDTSHNIADVALMVGYRNVQSLNRFFKKYEGISPNQYRKQFGVLEDA